MLREALDEIPPLLSALELLARVRLKVSAKHEALRELAMRANQPVTGTWKIVVLIIRNKHFACLWAGNSRPIYCGTGRSCR